MIKMVVFDMAGTTVDEDNLVYKTMLSTINRAGYSITLHEVLFEAAGKEKMKAIQDIFTSRKCPLDHGLLSSIYSSFLKELETAYFDYPFKPHAGAEEIFSFLRERNILVVLNTGYSSIMAFDILAKLKWNIGRVVNDLITSSDVSHQRPDPSMIFLAMERFHLKNSIEIIKVGDSIVDIEEGKNAGCGITIGITTGAQTYEQLLTAKPDKIIDKLLDLIPIILEG